MINECHTCKHKLKGRLMFKYLTTSALISCVISKTKRTTSLFGDCLFDIELSNSNNF